MDRVRCARCGEEHDLSDMEPGFDRPDAWFAIPAAEREARSRHDSATCVLWEADGSGRRHFLRVVLPIPVRGEKRAFCWGVWVEVSADDFAHTLRRWDESDQHLDPSFDGALANAFPNDPTTLGARGRVHLTGPGEVPAFTLDADAHPLATEQQEGVFPERVLEWIAPALHPAEGDSRG